MRKIKWAAPGVGSVSTKLFNASRGYTIAFDVPERTAVTALIPNLGALTTSGFTGQYIALTEFVAASVASALSGLVSRGPAADSDLQWFYSDPRRVVEYAGRFVSVLNKRVVGSGTSAEASSAADDALVFYVPTSTDLDEAELGLL
jgi:hypothetical protein